MSDRVAVVAPVYRNATTLPRLVDRLDAAMTGHWVLRLVIDACPDGSAEVAHRLAAQDDRIRVTVLSQNVGQHTAIARGLSDENEADAWVCLDADLQDPPEAVPLLLTTLQRPGVAGAIAGRAGAYESPGRLLTGGLHRRVLAAVTGLPRDAGAFFAMDRRLRDAVIRAVLQFGAPSVVVAAGASGLTLVSTAVARDRRVEGRSAWTSRARLRQSIRTLRWALRHRTTANRAAANPAASGQHSGQIVRFLLIGVLGTLAYLAVFVALRTFLSADVANISARVGVAIPTTWLNARTTFATRASITRVVAGALFVLAVTTGISGALLRAEQVLAGSNDRPAEVAALVIATGATTVVRFYLLRQVIFRRRGRTTTFKPTPEGTFS